ncbi:hypothetical protein D9M68_905020 [compost metagenome]
MGALGCGLFQPVAGLLRLIDPRKAAQAAQLQLRAAVAGAGGLTQHVQADAAIAVIAAVAAEHLAQAALRCHHPVPRRLLEQFAGESLHARRLAQARAVQQPQGDARRQGLRGGSGIGRDAVLHEFGAGGRKGAQLYSFFLAGKVLQLPQVAF